MANKQKVELFTSEKSCVNFFFDTYESIEQAMDTLKKFYKVSYSYDIDRLTIEVVL